jgi:hypothetical protein
MAVFHWLGGHSANFADALNWNPQQEPGAGDDALIDLAGTFTVQANGAFTVNRLALASASASTCSAASPTAPRSSASMLAARPMPARSSRSSRPPTGST